MRQLSEITGMSEGALSNMISNLIKQIVSNRYVLFSIGNADQIRQTHCTGHQTTKRNVPRGQSLGLHL